MPASTGSECPGRGKVRGPNCGYGDRSAGMTLRRAAEIAPVVLACGSRIRRAIGLTNGDGGAVKLPRRKFLRLAGGAAALPALSRIASAQNYPTRPLRFVTGYPPGGAIDFVARIIGRWLSERLGQPVVIENKPGAGTNLAVQAVVAAPPDGYTLLLAVATNAINATLYESLPFVFLRDIAPVAGLVELPLVLEVNPAVPVKTIADLIAYAKANPGRINMASFGGGTIAHLAIELFKTMTATEMVHVPYRGGAPMITDLIAGQVQGAVDALPNSLPHIRSGAIRALALLTNRRTHVLPD